VILYFAGAEAFLPLLQEAGADCLFSYYYIQSDKRVDLSKVKGRVFLDSGAFTAMTKGVTIDLNAYAEFVKRVLPFLTVYANLDVIGDYVKTRENQERMEALGLAPMATFHARSPYEELERMVERYDYIALGGIARERNKSRLRAHLDNCFSIVRRKPGLKTHAYGLNAWWIWDRYPFYSVDATSYIVGGKYRRLMSFDSKSRKPRLIGMQDDEESMMRWRAIVEKYKKLNLRNILSLMEMARFATRAWKERGVDWDAPGAPAVAAPGLAGDSAPGPA